MRLFSYLHKSSFWPQFVLGVLAIFALPNVQDSPERAQNSALNQPLTQVQQETVTLTQREQALFFAETNAAPPALKAVQICKIFAKLDRLQTAQPPIRAGPVSV